MGLRFFHCSSLNSIIKIKNFCATSEGTISESVRLSICRDSTPPQVPTMVFKYDCQFSFSDVRPKGMPNNRTQSVKERPCHEAKPNLRLKTSADSNYQEAPSSDRNTPRAKEKRFSRITDFIPPGRRPWDQTPRARLRPRKWPASR